jgi:hypothetical protein
MARRYRPPWLAERIPAEVIQATSRAADVSVHPALRPGAKYSRDAQWSCHIARSRDGRREITGRASSAEASQKAAERRWAKTDP